MCERGGYIPDSRFRVNGNNIFSSNIFNSTGHFTAESDHGTIRRNACEPSDQELFRRHAVVDSVLIPSTFNGDTIVAGDNVAVLNPRVGTRICNKPEIISARFYKAGYWNFKILSV